VSGNSEFESEHLQHAVEIAEDFIVPDADHSIAERIQVGVAALIQRAVRMLPAIDLDNQALLAADEIDVIRSNRLLSGELYPDESTIAQRQP